MRIYLSNPAERWSDSIYTFYCNKTMGISLKKSKGYVTIWGCYIIPIKPSKKCFAGPLNIDLGTDFLNNKSPIRWLSSSSDQVLLITPSCRLPLVYIYIHIYVCIYIYIYIFMMLINV